MAAGPWAALQHRLRRLTPYDVAAALLIAVLLVFVLATFRDYSISNDEEVQHRYGELILAYYASGFTDDTVFHYKNLYLYGGLYDVIAVALAHALPGDLYLIRHLFCALIGVVGVVLSFATARLVAGPRAGLLAAAAITVSGPYLGSMFNHTKDIPFAAAMVGATYFIIRAARDLPRPQFRHVLGYGLCLGAALGIRAMGLLLIVYAAVALTLHLPRPLWRAATAQFIAIAFVRMLPGFALAYAIMLAAWPWAALDLFNPVRALFAFADFHYQIRTMFAGAVYEMASVPRWYVPGYLAIKLPLVVLIGAALALALRRHRETGIIAFAALFPLACEAIGRGPAFDGFRHFLFVAPLLAVLAGIGCDAWLAALTPHRLRAAGIALLAAGFAWPAVALVQLHPYESLFFNPLVGGLQGASRRYIMDYWVNGMQELVAGLSAYIERTGGPASGDGGRYTVGVCGERFAFEDYAGPKLQWTPGWLEADFFIAPSHMSCDRLLNGPTVFTVQRQGVTIGVVKDLRGIPADRRWSEFALHEPR